MTRDAAIAATMRGWAVFPCRPGDKRPAVQDWENRACADPARVARYWPSPRHNYGIACGPSGLVVLDLDAHGELPDEWQLPGINDGRDVFYQVCEWAGMDWPSTYTVFTPSGGMHLYFRAPGDDDFRNKAGNTFIGPMIDIRAQGGYVVGAGSAISAGEYVLTDDQDAQHLPRWIAKALMLTGAADRQEARARGGTAIPADAGRRLAGLIRAVEESRAGNRTGALVWAAFTLRDMIAASEASPDDGELLVQAAIRAGINGGERYARQQVTSVLRRPA
jgi:hypothetical protein